MNHRHTVQAVARRLPHLSRHTVAEVLEVVAEVWAAELVQPGQTVTVMNLGKLRIDAQQLKVSGAIKAKLGADAPPTVQRLYYRFRPSGWLREEVEKAYETQEK